MTVVCLRADIDKATRIDRFRVSVSTGGKLSVSQRKLCAQTLRVL